MHDETFKPVGNRVLVKRKLGETVTKGGIYLPDSIQKKLRQGVVVAVGPGKVNKDGHLVPLEVKMGDEVFFTSYSGTEYEEDFIILSEEDLLAVVL